MDLKELLGEAYTEELESAIGAAYIPNDGTYIPKINAQGEATRLKKERDDAIAKATALETASLTEAEKIQKAIDDANAIKSQSLKMMSKLELQSGLSATGIDLTKHAETLDMLVGDNPEMAKTLSAGLQKIIAEAVLSGETKANVEHLKNNGKPQGNSSAAITRADFKTMTLDARMELSRTQPELYQALMKEG